MIRIAHANGKGTCHMCAKPIPKGDKQLVVELGSGMNGKSARTCMPCLKKILEEES